MKMSSFLKISHLFIIIIFEGINSVSSLQGVFSNLLCDC